MKLVTYSEKKSSKKTRPGLVWGEWLVDTGQVSRISKKLDVKLPRKLQRVADDSSSLVEILNSGPKVIEELQTASWRLFNRIKPSDQKLLRKTESVKLHSPIPRPPTIRDFYAFENHVKAARARRGLQMAPEWYEFPAFYYSNPSVVYGPDENVPAPTYTKSLDFELEVACVIGVPGMNISEQSAQAHIAGYTIMNDWSARDTQEKEMKIGLGPAKAKDFATSLGPWLVTPDELEDKRIAAGKFSLAMAARVNGRQVSQGNMGDMHWSFPQMVARASQSVRLEVGDVFGSGTVGSGSILELGTGVQRWLLPADIVELEVERLGVLRNAVVAADEN